MKKYIKGNKYKREVNGKIVECVYLGREFGDYIFEIVGTTLLLFVKE